MSELNLAAAAAAQNVVEIRTAMHLAVDWFQALPDAEVARFGVGGESELESSATVAEHAARIRERQRAVMECRISVLDAYLAALAVEEPRLKDIVAIELFISAWTDEERILRRYENIPGRAWRHLGCPDASPQPLEK